MKANLDKKTEKNYTFYIKYMIKESLKKDKKDYEKARDLFS